MMEYLASVLNAEKLRKSEDAGCPRSYCVHEYRNEQPRTRVIPLRNV